MSSENWDAWVAIKWKAGAPDDVWEKWSSDKIKSCWTTTGEWDCFLWLNVHDFDELEDFVWHHVRTHEWVDETQSWWAKSWEKQPATHV